VEEDDSVYVRIEWGMVIKKRSMVGKLEVVIYDGNT